MKKSEIDLIELIASLTETSDPLMYQYFKNLEKHTLLITDNISPTATELYIMPLLEWDADDSVKEIKIYINCLGGDVFNGMMIADVINKLKTKTVIELLSYSYSMGGFIATAGSLNPNVKTICHEFSTFLIHAGSTMLSGDSSTVEDTLDFYKNFNGKMVDFMVRNTNITKEKIEEMKRVEWFLDSTQMLEYGIVDEIV